MGEENWWPSKEEYDPKITKEKWLELLKDENIFNFNSMCMMRRFLDIGGEATCVDTVKEFGRNVNFYNNGNWLTGDESIKRQINHFQNTKLMLSDIGGLLSWLRDKR